MTQRHRDWVVIVSVALVAVFITVLWSNTIGTLVDHEQRITRLEAQP